MAASKVTLTLPDEVLREVNRHVREHSGSTRSGVCAEALRRWLLEQQEREIVAYYESMSETERAEDRAWSGPGGPATRSANRLWQ